MKKESKFMKWVKKNLGVYDRNIENENAFTKTDSKCDIQ